MVLFTIGLLIVTLVLQSYCKVKAADETSAPSFYMLLQFEIYTIDRKTDTIYSSNYYFQMKAINPDTPNFTAVILKPHFDEAVTCFSSNETGTNQVYEPITVSKPDLYLANRWRLNPKRCLPPLGSPWDHYELSFLMALNISTNLVMNHTLFIMPIPLQGDWDWTENPRVDKLSKVPDNQTLISHGLSPEKFYDAGGNNMTDFYLITESFSFKCIYSTRISLIFFTPSIVILLVLAFSALRFRELKISDFLTLYLGTAFFILSFLVSFDQYAPSTALTWQEILFYSDFLFCTVLVLMAIWSKKNRPGDNDKKEPRPDKEEDMPSSEGEKPARTSRFTTNSIDKAFEWFALVQTVLLSIVFQTITWMMKPESNYKVATHFMFSLTAPLVLSIIAWIWQLIISKPTIRIFLRLFSWSILLMTFSSYVMVFFTLVVLGITQEFCIVAAIVILTGSLAFFLFPAKKILNTYKAATESDGFWKRHPIIILSPYIMGVLIGIILFSVIWFF